MIARKYLLKLTPKVSDCHLFPSFIEYNITDIYSLLDHLFFFARIYVHIVKRLPETQSKGLKRFHEGEIKQEREVSTQKNIALIHRDEEACLFPFLFSRQNKWLCSVDGGSIMCVIAPFYLLAAF